MRWQKGHAWWSVLPPDQRPESLGEIPDVWPATAQDGTADRSQVEVPPLCVPVQSLPQVGNVIDDPQILGLIDIAKSLNVPELRLVDPEDQEMVFRF